jgi:thiol-disulfide isomerase/thioredoxin
MNKRVAIISVVIVLLTVGGVLYLTNRPRSQSTTENQAPTANSQSTSEKQGSESMNQVPASGSYVDYRDGIIAETKGTKILFFHAPWCPQCRALESDIKQAGVPQGVTIIKVDYDSSQKLRQQYGVTLQTTVVRVDDAGSLVKKFVAYDDPSLAAIKEALL